MLTLLCGLFTQNGYKVSEARTGNEMRKVLAVQAPDLVILDLNLPDESGFVLARELRASCEAGLIILTARQEGLDRLIGLEMGADDYLTKPVDERELLVRVRNLLKRIPAEPHMGTTDTAQLTFRFDGWRFLPFRHNLISQSDEIVRLTRAESDLLHALLERPGAVQTRQQLIDAIHGHNVSTTERTIDVLVLRLRRKLGDEPRAPRYIMTLPGTGYYFAGEVSR